MTTQNGGNAQEAGGDQGDNGNTDTGTNTGTVNSDGAGGAIQDPAAEDPARKKWEYFAAISVWLVALIVVFVSPPPPMELKDYGDGNFGPAHSNMRFLSQFIITMILAAFWLVGSQSRSLNTLRAHVAIAFVWLILAVALLFGYNFYKDAWSCSDYLGYGPILIGDQLTAIGREYLQEYPDATCVDFLLDNNANPKEPWEASQIDTRYHLLSGWFAGIVVCFALATVTMLHAIALKLGRNQG